MEDMEVDWRGYLMGSAKDLGQIQMDVQGPGAFKEHRRVCLRLSPKAT